MVSAQDDGLEPVVLQLKWSHQFQFAGYYMAKELGYYENEGIHLEIRPGSSKVNVTEEVLSGRADFGVGTSSLLIDYAAGKPVVVLGVIYQHSPLVLIMRTEKSSDTIEHVADGKVMLEPNSGDLLAMLRRAGFKTEDLELTGYPTTDIVELLEFSEDPISISAYQTDEPYTLLKKNVSFSVLTPQTYGIDFYGDNFFTTRKTLEERKETALGFRRATILGWEAVMRDPQKAIALILEKYASAIDREKLQYEARVTRDLMTNLVKPGHMNLERWQHISDTLQEVDMLDERPNLSEFLFIEEEFELPAWFWPVLSGLCVLALSLVLVSLYFRRLNSRLNKEIKLRHESELNLKLINEQLAEAKMISEKANQQKTWFITNVTHDLRAPVSAMISLTQIFNHHGKSLNLPEKFNRFLGQLHAGGEFLMLLLNNILDQSAFELNAVKVSPERIETDKCFNDILNLVQPLADEKNVSVEVRWTSDYQDIIIDRVRLIQIVLNLLHNAVKFSPQKGGITLDLRIEDHSLHVDVGDEGPGIPPDREQDLFRMFGASNKDEARYSSTGLGLSIVKRNVDLLGGVIQVLEGKPSGVLFKVKIPISLPEN